ncbi:hypothetical protein D3W54_00810 [Komagataeibacter medellinensis]|uniref:Transposase n=1 Tax=Komagataeibacter medellinensis TaxID=1177712 RepID=A0ABQ6VV95_9PROT|nr:hypothetical protein D3W54_00810 [Komagataeibacter medellinensis]
MAVIRLARKESAGRQWATKLLEKKAARVVSVVLANKTARIVWAVLTTDNEYSRPECLTEYRDLPSSTDRNDEGECAEW